MKGFTLIEVLITAGIFIIILVIIANVIILGNQIYWEEEKAKEVMQNGRVVLDSISREIRQSRKIITSLPDEDCDNPLDEDCPPSEIIFQDGHLGLISENGITSGGLLDKVILSNSASESDGFYNNAFLKIISGSPETIGEIRKIIDYNGDLKEARLDFPISDSIDYFGLEYIINTSYYYIHYYLDEDGFVQRKTFSFYFSGNSYDYVPFNAVPPDGETMEIEVLENPRIIGEHFKDIKFWGSKIINISLSIELDGREIQLSQKIFGRNL